MKRRILCFVLTMAMVLSMLVVIPATTVSAEIEVDSEGALHISTAADLRTFRDAVNNGDYDSGVTVYLEDDIDLSGENWSTSIGNSTNPFKGYFDGQGHTISGLTRTGGTFGQSGGLFGTVSSVDGEETTIGNFKLAGSIVGSNGGDNVGTVVCAAKPSTTGEVTVSIIGVWSTVNFDASAAKMTGVGGILGTIAWCTSDYEITVNIDSCRYSGTLNSPSAGSNDYGGILGYPKEAASPRTINITNCIFDGSIVLYGSTPDDNGGIVGYFKGNGGNSRQTNIYISDCIVAGKFEHKNTSNQTVTGYVVSEKSGSNTDYAVTNVYYCNDSDRHTGGAMGGWYGYMKGGSTDPSGITKTNVTAKTMTQLKTMTSGFDDDDMWHFYNNGSDLPIPAMIYDNIIANQAPSIFSDLSQDEYTITTADELMEFASVVNDGGSNFLGKTVYLGADINLTGYSWVSIGKKRTEGATFRGTFDGQGHTISNMTSTVNNPDGEGGLFGYVVYDATIRNFHLTGTITMTTSGSGDKGYFGSIIGCAFQTTATINLSNIWSSVNINCSNSGARGLAIGGLVGQIRSSSNMGTLTLNIDSCVYDGSISDGNRFDCVGGFIGRTHENASGRPLNLTISNSVFAGSIHVNDIYSEDISCLIGYIKGNGSGGGAVNVTITNVVSTGRVFFYTGDSREWSPISKCVGGILSSEITGTVPVVTVTNIYYKNFQVPVGAANAATWQDTALFFNTPTCTVNVSATAGKKTQNELLALTTADFTDASKWNKTTDYYPCPKSIADTFGLPTSLYVEPTDIYVGTAEALNALATAVNGGKTYEGKNIFITADITIESGWTSIGITSSRPFMGNFDGQGHTIEIHQTLSNPDGVGGLIAFSRTPAGGEVTIENLHLTGRIDATNTNTGSGYFGGLVSTVDGNTSGSGGTINITNVWNSVYVNCGNANMWTGVGGFIGFVRHADGLKPLTVNFDSCLWDGTLNVGPAAYHFGGYVGYTGNNKAGRTLTINIANSVAAGKIAINIDWNQYAGVLIGYARGGYSSDATAKVTVNVSDVVSNGYMTFKSGTPGSGSKIGHIGRIDDTTNNEINMTNLYYNPFSRGNLEGNAPALDGDANTSDNVVAKSTKAEQYALTASDFSDSTKWNKTNDYIVCPAGIVTTFGAVPGSLEITEYDRYDEFTIGNVTEFIAFRDAVNGGKTYSGKTVKLTTDIDLAGEDWVGIGSRSAEKVFSGTFDGQGHTISNLTVASATSETGALFCYAGNATIQNFILTGTITFPEANVNFMGSVVNCIYGTSTLRNVRSRVNFTPVKNGYSVNYTGGLIGFLHNSNNSDLTIDDCEYAGNINTGGMTNSVSGILGYTGWGRSGVTKTVTITNTIFSGSINFNDPGYYNNNGGLIGYVKYEEEGANITINISNSHSGGKLYFKRSVAWTSANCGKCGQLIGCVDTGVVLNIDSDVTYSKAYLYTEVKEEKPVEDSKVYLGEIGMYGETAPYDTDAVPASMEVDFSKRDVNDKYKGIRFTATFTNTATCTGGGTKSANFGIYLLTRETYELLGGTENITKSKLDTAVTTAGNVVKVQATKYLNNISSYVVNAVVYNLNTDLRKATELVAIPYAASDIGTAYGTTYNSVFN